jgi:regulator of replication initiation timing
MRDTKSLLLLLVSLLLVVVSFILIWTWGYSYYKNSANTKTELKPVAADRALMVNRLKDSLQKEFSATLQELDLQLSTTVMQTDSLKTELDTKLAEFYRLRNEIAAILKNRNTGNNFSVARQKITELQTRVADLKEKNQDVEKENKKLDEALTQLGNTEKANGKNIKNGNAVKDNTADRPSPVYPVFTASDLRLAAVMNAGEKETETAVAEKTDKLEGSFTVVNFNSQFTNAEMIVVVLGPGGRVLKNSAWDSGTFNTAEGKKVYSYKFNFPYTMGEAKRLLFTLKPAGITRGNYTMEVYHNGILIGKTVKTLA